MTGNPAELGQYLRARRQRLAPADIGLPAGGRRRTSGLRRTEVAGLAGISVDWYTRLEQGRGVRASAQVLDSLARALRLDAAERQHLFHLARGEFPPIGAAPPDDVPAYLHQFLCYLEPSPAMLLGRRLDVIYANHAAAAYFGDPATWADGHCNLVARLCLDPALRQVLGAGWNEITANMVAELRAAAARWPGDHSFAQVISALHRHSPDFTRWWDDHQVRASSGGPVILHHPRHGPVPFQQKAFHPADAPHLRVVAYLPGDADSREPASQLARPAARIQPGTADSLQPGKG
jgi:transcriptional regulator with XRE-family HTH domain